MKIAACLLPPAVALFVASIAAYITHIVVCINAWTTEYLLFLIIGALFPPIAIVHGVMQWFGG